MDKVVVTKSKLDSLAQHINAKAGTTGAKTIDQMQATVDGITGKEEEAITVPLDMANGDQIVTPSEGKTLSQVTITKPDDLSPSRVVLGSNIGGVDGNYFAPEIWVLNEEIIVPAKALTFTDLAFLTYATRKIDTNDPFPIQTMFRVAPTGKVGIVSRDAAGNVASIKRPAAMSSGDYTDTNGWYGESAHPQIGRIMVFLQPTHSRDVQSWLRQNAVLYGGDTVIAHKKGLFELGDIDFAKELNVTANGAYSIKPNAPYSAFGSAAVNVNVPVPAVQDTKALTITSNGTVSVTPDAPYDALKKVDVTVNVASGGGSPTDPYIEYTSLDSSGRVFTAKFRGTIVPEHAFSYLAELTSVDMPDNVIAIGDNGFYRCPKLSLTSLPPGITSLGDYAFSDCSKLALTSLPSGITSIGDQAFRDCSSLALTSLPSKVTSIGDYTFRNCGRVALTSLPSGITSIGDFAFLNCYQLSLTALPSGITSIGQYAFNNCPRLALTTLPPGITSLPTAAFQYCPKLALTTFPSGMTSIGAYAFRQGTGLASITLPPALTTIGDFAFSNCTGLETVRFTSTVSSIPNGVFSGCTKLSTIYVPWSQGQVANAPWGASNATIVYDYTEN